MKRILQLLVCIIFTNGSIAQTIDSLKIIPENLTTNDEIELIAFTFHFQQSCHVINSNVSIFEDSIRVEALHNLGPLPSLCYRVDTFNLGYLETGHYILRHYIHNNVFPNYLNVDSIEFDVQLFNSVFEIGSEGLKIFPNPASSSVTIKSEYPFSSYSIFNSFGKILELKGLANSRVSEIDVSKLSRGIYFLKVHDGKKLVGTHKLIIE